MQETLESETGQSLYAKRKVTEEPVFGQIEEVLSIRRFRLRSLATNAWSSRQLYSSLRKPGAGPFDWAKRWAPIWNRLNR
jgi:hypothetical protein